MPYLLALLFALPLSCAALELDSKIGLASRIYQHAPAYAEQARQYGSVFAELEFYQAWNADQDSIKFVPYLRLDQHDNARSHADVRELLWLHVGDDWEFRAGISKVFWGVMEGNHLVDIINQNDWVDDISGDEKLGQPLLNLNLIQDWGTLGLFVLPYFREATYPGIAGRLRGDLPIATDSAAYESGARAGHVDLALRWSHTFAEYDLGLSYFRGTARTPRLRFQDGVLIPYYEQIQQLGLDAQATLESWLWKFEAIYRDDAIDRYAALSGGFEYSFFDIWESGVDLGWIMEYSWDQRGENQQNIFQNDLMLGLRLALNYAQGSELLLGVVQDLDDSAVRSVQLEASRRLGENWRLNLEWRVFSDNPKNLFSTDDHLQLSLSYFF